MGGRVLGWCLKGLGIALAVVLLVRTIRSTSANPLEALSHANLWLLLAGFLCVGATHVLGAHRFGCMLEVQGVSLTYWLLLKLTWVGNFFSQIIPGAVSGDILKLAYIAKARKGQGAEAFLTIVMDRVVGVAGLFLVASLGGLLFLACHWELAMENRVIGLSLLVVFLGGICSVAGLLVMMYHKWFIRWNLLARLVHWLALHLPKALTGMFTRLCNGADLYRDHKLVIVYTLLISMVIHASLGTALYCVGYALGEDSLGYGAYFLSTQIGNAVTMVPTTPGGLGLRDTVSAAFLAAFDAAPGGMTGSIPVVYSMLVVSWGLVGAVCLLFLDKDKEK